MSTVIYLFVEPAMGLEWVNDDGVASAFKENQSAGSSVEGDVVSIRIVLFNN